MKSILLFAAISFIIISCNPSAGLELNLETVIIGATLNNTNVSIALGDTLTMKVKIPDVVSSTSGNINVQSLQRTQFYMYINKIDTITNRATLIPSAQYWTTKGTISSTSPFDFLFNTNSAPYEVILNFKPQAKGIYYLEVISQPGKIRVNNAYDGRVVVNFNVPNQHLHLATPFFGVDWTNNAQTIVSGTYVFRVI